MSAMIRFFRNVLIGICVSIVVLQVLIFANAPRQAFDRPYVQYPEDAAFVTHAKVNDWFRTEVPKHTPSTRKTLGEKWNVTDCAENCGVVQDTHLIMFLRMMKTGSTTMSDLIRSLSGMNGFLVDMRRVKLDANTEESVRHDLMRYFDSFQRRAVHTAHGPFLDFEEEGFVQPAYATVMRHPILRLISHYNYVHFGDRGLYVRLTRGQDRSMMTFETCVRTLMREDDEPSSSCMPSLMNVQLTLLCGSRRECFEDSEIALRIAKRNIATSFAVVGITELMNCSIQVLERVFPTHFHGMTRLYRERSTVRLRVNAMSSASHFNFVPSSESTNQLCFDATRRRELTEALRTFLTQHIPSDVLSFLTRKMRHEIALYDFALDRFVRQVGSCAP